MRDLAHRIVYSVTQFEGSLSHLHSQDTPLILKQNTSKDRLLRKDVPSRVTKLKCNI